MLGRGIGSFMMAPIGPRQSPFGRRTHVGRTADMAKLTLASASSLAPRRDYPKCYNVASGFCPPERRPASGAVSRTRNGEDWRGADERRRSQEKEPEPMWPTAAQGGNRAEKLARLPSHFRRSPARTNARPVVSSQRQAQSRRNRGDGRRGRCGALSSTFRGARSGKRSARSIPSGARRRGPRPCRR